MKHLFFISALCLLLASCQVAEVGEDTGTASNSAPTSLSVYDQLKDQPNGTYEVDGVKYKKFTVTATGMEESIITARSTATEASMTDIYVFDTSTSTSTSTLLLHQASTDEGFGTMTLILPYGDHSLTFIAGRGKGVAYSDGVLSWTKPRQTYTCQKNITIQGATRLEQQVTMSRYDAQLKVMADDELPAGVKADYTLSERYTGINVATLAPTSRTASWAWTEDFTGDEGKTGTYMSFYLFLPDEDGTVDVKVRYYDTAGTLAEHTKAGVTLQRNAVTTLHGELLKASNDTELTFDTQMNTPIDVPMY